ncbi:MAG TPA: hypothetical protein VIT44_10720 [Cyclobacteriaceae bacterium]
MEMLILTFKTELTTEDINDAIIRIRAEVMGEFKLIRFVIIQPEVIES